MKQNSRSGDPAGDFQLGFPIRSSSCDGCMVKRNDPWDAMGEGRCWIEVRMTGEAADFAEYFLLEEHVTRCRYNLIMLKRRHA